MAQRKPQVNVAIDENQKERWENVVANDPRFATLSDLIRISVENNISNSRNSKKRDEKQILNLIEQVESLEHQIGGLSGDFQELKGIIKTQSPTNQNLKSEAFAALPESGQMGGPAKPEDIASKIGGPVDIEAVSEVLNELASQTGQVEAHIYPDEGDIRYSKKGE